MSKLRVIHVRISISKQNQIITSSVAKVKFIKTKAIFRSHIPKASQTKFYQIRIKKSKVIHIQNGKKREKTSTEMGKTKK